MLRLHVPHVADRPDLRPSTRTYFSTPQSHRHKTRACERTSPITSHIPNLSPMRGYVVLTFGIGVEQNNAGTLKRRRELVYEPWFAKMQRSALLKSRDPERCRKIAEARRGKPRPTHVIEAMRQGNLGRVSSIETRRKMSEAHRRRGTRPPWIGKPWSAAEDALLDKLTPPEVAQRTGRTVVAVRLRRGKLSKLR